jgi:hypothetical protein
VKKETMKARKQNAMQGEMVEQKKKADDGKENKAGCPGNLKQVSQVSRCRWQHPG